MLIQLIGVSSINFKEISSIILAKVGGGQLPTWPHHFLMYDALVYKPEELCKV